MVETETHLVGPRIGVEGRAQAFRDAFTRALGQRHCVGWSSATRPDDLNTLDAVVVEDIRGAEHALARWPDVTLVRWGRPVEPASHISWDGWINRALDASEAADVLIELLSLGLLGRFHGPTTSSIPTFSK